MNGQIVDMPAADYHAHPALSRSRLWDFGQSARAFRAVQTGEMEGKEETESMRLGSLVHAMIFEPDELKRFVTIPVEMLSSDGKATTKAAKLFKEDHADKTIVTANSYEAAQKVVKSLLASRFAEWLALPGAKKEQTILWTDEETGVDLRCRVDLLLPAASGLVFVADLKTTQDASPKAFRYSIKDYGYWLQYALYADGIEAATGKRPHEWYYVAASTKGAFEVAFHYLSMETKAVAVEKYRDLLRQYAQAKATNVWRSPWDGDVNEIHLRDWEF